MQSQIKLLERLATRNFSISDQRNVLGLKEKGIYYFISSFPLWLSFCHSHLLSNIARDSTAKFCPSVESATCAGYFLTLQMNQSMYCYQKKKKTQHLKKASFAVLCYHVRKSSGQELPRPAGAGNAGDNPFSPQKRRHLWSLLNDSSLANAWSSINLALE